jgi:ribosomal protein S18 acetylase RimI-like enzyme
MTINPPSLIHHIEELAANAWPAAVMQTIDGWRLRFSWNVTRRANSVWPNGAGNSHILAQKLDWVEAFYARWGGPARYQICPAAQPSDLDAVLEARSYITEALTAVQHAPLAVVLKNTNSERAASVTVSETFSPEWFAAYCEAESVGEEEARGRRGILGRIGPRVGYALVRQEGRVVGMGLAVMERGFVGIYNMTTHPDFRRQGLASAALYALAAWGKANEATHMYLQVMENNAPAKALYGKVGFETLYHYHYRTFKPR